MKKLIITLTQHIVTQISWTLNCLFLSPKVSGLEHLDCLLCLQEEEDVSVVFVANHLSEIDPFAITAYLGFEHKLALFPITFLSKKELHAHWSYDWFMRLLGCVPVGYKEKAERHAVIAKMQGFAQRRETIFLFPEGRMMRNGEFGEDQGGVKILCRSSKIIVMPIRINGLEPLATNFKRFMRKARRLIGRRYQFSVMFGAPFVLPEGRCGLDVIELIKTLPIEAGEIAVRQCDDCGL